MLVRQFRAGRLAVHGGRTLDICAGQPLLAVRVHKHELRGRAQRLHGFFRIGDLRDLDRDAVVARKRDSRLGEALVGQALTDHGLRRFHIAGQVARIVALRQLRLIYDARTAHQIEAEPDAVLGIIHRRDDRAPCNGKAHYRAKTEQNDHEHDCDERNHTLFQCFTASFVFLHN